MLRPSGQRDSEKTIQVFDALMKILNKYIVGTIKITLVRIKIYFFLNPGKPNDEFEQSLASFKKIINASCVSRIAFAMPSFIVNQKTHKYTSVNQPSLLFFNEIYFST